MALNLTIFSSASSPIWAIKKEKVWLLHPLAQIDVSNRTTLTYRGNNPHLTPLANYNENLCPSALWTLLMPFGSKNQPCSTLPHSSNNKSFSKHLVHVHSLISLDT